jgi:hypothetical protein
MLKNLAVAALAAVVGASAAAYAVSPQAVINAGNVNAACSFTPTQINLNPDGTFNVVLSTTLNGRQPALRQNWISADGTQFALDGVAIASPPTALQQLGAHLSAASAKISAAYSVPAVQAVVCGP